MTEKRYPFGAEMLTVDEWRQRPRATRAPLPDTCPKCGNQDNPSTGEPIPWSGPTYKRTVTTQQDGAIVRECLVYACRVCGFTIHRPTFDARQELPDPNPVTHR